MVQRKLLNNKLGIKTDHHHRSEKSSSPSQKQDTKNKGADLMKKMKKSRSIKNSGIDSLRSSPPLRSKDIAQRGRPPTSDYVNTRAANLQRQAPVEPSEASPNYMKSTSSFDARKEHSQVSSQTRQNSMIWKSLSPMKSNKMRCGSGSDHKAVRILTKTTSLKLVRTLTRTPSFKPTRASMKNYSPIALCEDFELQKPTCSSSLKDSKFQTNLELSIGGTESEGTSAMKVCPYRYCSLNGHHHDPVPPLKSFLSAKRCLLKAQKIIRLQCLSPRRAKPSREKMIESGAKQKMLVEKLPTEGDIRPIIPLMHKNQADFFIEITSNDMADTARGKTRESLSSTAPCSDIDFEEYLDQCRGNVVLTLNNNKLFKGKDQNVEAGGHMHPLPIAEEDATLASLSVQGNSLKVCQHISQGGQSDSHGSDMEWEAGNHYEQSLCEDPILQLKGTDTYPVSDSESRSKSEDDINNSYEDILSDAMSEGFQDEISVNSGAWSDDGDSHLDGSYQNIFFSDSYLSGYEQIQAKSYSTCDALEDLTSTVEKDEKHGSGETQAHSNEEFKIITLGKSQFPEANDVMEIDFELGSNETKFTSGVEDGALFGHQGNETAQEDSFSWLLQNQDSNSVEDFMENHQDGTHKGYSTTHDSIEFYEFDSIHESRLSNEVTDESLTIEIECNEAFHEEKIPNIDDKDEMEEEELAVKSFLGIQTFELLEDCEQETARSDARDGIEGREQLQLLAPKSFVRIQSSEILQDFVERTEDTMADINNAHIKQESETNETCAVKTLRHENNGLEDHGFSEVNQDKSDTCKFTSSKHSGDQAHLESAVLQSTTFRNQEADTGEDESKTEPDTAETRFTAKSSTSTQKEDYIFNICSNSKYMSEAAKISNWTTGGRKNVEESDEIKNFNPREPNYLPVETDSETEKVNLRHQIIDERKNAEEWMVDYALRQAVTKIDPARRRKVALLVEAFEKVLPTAKYETHLRHTSAAFVQAQSIQACR